MDLFENKESFGEQFLEGPKTPCLLHFYLVNIDTGMLLGMADLSDDYRPTKKEDVLVESRTSDGWAKARPFMSQEQALRYCAGNMHIFVQMGIPNWGVRTHMRPKHYAKTH